MTTYLPPLRHMIFVLQDWLDAASDWRGMPAFADLDPDTVNGVLEEAARFATRRLQPLNGPGDMEGCCYERGTVRTPTGFAAAYREFVASGWPSLSCASDFGGQGLPQLLNFALYEMLTSANHAWAMYPGLLHGAYECIRAHGSAHLRNTYLPYIVSGEWLATMCLTEPQAGSDLSLLRARAEPGSSLSGEIAYRIDGTKIFVSGGAQDLTSNIVHLVLARLPDAPSGTRGLSLFLVPQNIPAGGSLHPNRVYCDGIEHKMGLKGSATCVMRLDQATGWLIGEPHNGLAAMFIMMNAARLHVGIQGLAHAESAYQAALGYGQQRVQMRAIRASGGAPTMAGPILAHPPIRRTVLELQAVAQGARALGYWVGHLLDLADHHQDEPRRLVSLQLCSLLTPAIKTLFTEMGFLNASRALQVHGGHGYLRDHGIEQTLRDARVPMIYEGTNEIQAIDLLVRKILQDRHDTLGMLLAQLRAEASACRALPDCRSHADALDHGCWIIDDCVALVREAVKVDAETPYRGAVEFCRAFGLLLLAFAWARTARVSDPHRATSDFHRHLVAGADAGRNFILPELDYRHAMFRRTCEGIPQFVCDAQ